MPAPPAPCARRPTATTETLTWSARAGTAKEGSDYQAGDGTLTFGAGDTTGTIDVTIVNDAEFEPVEEV